METTDDKNQSAARAGDRGRTGDVELGKLASPRGVAGDARGLR
jgi:hypothetical protein